jgi:hypothetical protein
MTKKVESLIKDLGLTKAQLYSVWKEYNLLSSEVGKANAISEMILSVEGINYDAFKYFIVLGFESINKEYFKEIENEK